MNIFFTFLFTPIALGVSSGALCVQGGASPFDARSHSDRWVCRTFCMLASLHPPIFLHKKGGFKKMRVVFFASLLLLWWLADAKHYTLRLKDNKYTVSDDAAAGDILASARYDETYNTTGWDYLRIDAAPELVKQGHRAAMQKAYYAVGYLEGYLTHDRMLLKYINSNQQVNATFNADPRLTQWIDNHTAFMTRLGSAE